MQRSIEPRYLIRQAYELAGQGLGPGQPRNTDLRRAVSAAYYALFHHVTLTTAGSMSLADAIERAVP